MDNVQGFVLLEGYGNCVIGTQKRRLLFNPEDRVEADRAYDESTWLGAQVLVKVSGSDVEVLRSYGTSAWCDSLVSELRIAVLTALLLAASPPRPSQLLEDVTSECPICLEALGREFHTMNCGHRFHWQCILTAAQTGNVRCPMCRADPANPNGALPPILSWRCLSEFLNIVEVVTEISVIVRVWIALLCSIC